jgi:hypothetical protein
LSRATGINDHDQTSGFWSGTNLGSGDNKPIGKPR